MSTKSNKRSRAPPSTDTFLDNWLKKKKSAGDADNDDVYGEKATQFPADVLDEAREVMIKGLVHGLCPSLGCFECWLPREGCPREG